MDKATPLDTFYFIYQTIQPIWNMIAFVLGLFGQFFTAGLDFTTFFLGFL